MLFPGSPTAYGYTFDNWGAAPSSTPGEVITSGSSGSEGSWVAVATAVPSDVYWIYLWISANLTGSGITFALDIGVDPAGGSSYSAVISDIIVGNGPSATQSGRKDYLFPLYAPAGSSIALRAMTSTISGLSPRVAIFLYGEPSNPLAVPRGTISQTFGSISGSVADTITPGNGSYGSWVDLGACAMPLWWFQMGYQIANNTITAEYTYFELAYGDASNKHLISRDMHSGTTAESSGFVFGTHLMGYCPVPAGANIYVRARCNNTPDSGYQVGVIGVGG